MEVELMFNCPVCGEYAFDHDGDNDVCNICGWENDKLQNNKPDYRGGANPDSLNEYRSEWKKKKEASVA